MANQHEKPQVYGLTPQQHHLLTQYVLPSYSGSPNFPLHPDISKRNEKRYIAARMRLDTLPSDTPRLRRAGLRLQKWSLEKPTPNALRTTLLTGGLLAGIALAGYEVIQVRDHIDQIVYLLTHQFKDAAMHYDFSKIDVGKFFSFHPQEAFKPVVDNHNEVVAAAENQIQNQLMEARNNGIVGVGSAAGGIIDLSFLRRKTRSRSLYFLGRFMEKIG
jgi:hypothetical protein